MRYVIWSLLIALIGIGIAGPVSGWLESETYLMPKNTISSGGTLSESASYSLTATLGQTSCIGRSNRGSLVLHAGFWTPEFFEMKPKTLPFIPLLLLED